MAYVIGLVWMTGAAFMTWKAAQLWRNATLVDFFLASFTVLPFGQEVRRGEVRSVGVTATSLWAITPLVFLGLLDAEMTGGQAAVVLMAVLIVLACMACEISIILFNVPARLVPPHMRSEPGTVALWRARRARKKSLGFGRRVGMLRAYRRGMSAPRRTATAREARLSEGRASSDETGTSHFPPHL
ncbi:hypothetical protein AB0C68_03135 [Streptomyces tendae]|uniref:hypothetical protein n=1 Tax=Streptomyces tendae TaxID=1932 RepID=UPI0033CF9B20